LSLPVDATSTTDDGAWLGGRWLLLLVAGCVVAGVALRFVSVGPLWLDEAQSVSIAAEPLRHIGPALRHDGAPPLWYALLHIWMRIFGDSTYSVRLMAVLPGLGALVAIERLGRRIGGPTVGYIALLLLATSPFAIHYSVEARMYSLVLLLSLLAAHALLSVHRTTGRWPVVALAVWTSLLLYTQYYAIWLGLVVSAGELWFAVRRGDRRSWWVLGAIAVAALTFLPWLPDFLYQTRHTGAPWLPPPSVAAVVKTVGAWAGDNGAVETIAQVLLLGLAAVAVLGRRGEPGTVVLGAPAVREPLRLFGVTVGVVVVAVGVDMVTKQAFVPRYTSIVVGFFVVVVAVGIVVLPSRRLRFAITAALAVGGLVVGGLAVSAPRSEAGRTVHPIEAGAHPGDVVFYCPDQLGPSAARILPASLGLTQLVYPTLAGPRRVDWVDYAKRQRRSQPRRIARQVDRVAAGHTIWFVWAPGFRTFGRSCQTVLAVFTSLRGSPIVAESPRTGKLEAAWVDAFPSSVG
jgi:mannosyltransferase